MSVTSAAQPAQAPKTASSSKSRRGFLEKSLAGLSDALEQSLFAEEIAHQKGLLQGIDPRVKLLGALALLLAVSYSHNLLVIGGIYLLTLPIAALSCVPPGFYLKRVWVFMPFFTGIIAIPALFNIFTPGPALITLIQTPTFTLSITYPGVVTAAFLLLRVGTSVSITILLILTTRWATVLRALRVLHVPLAIVLILGMTYRYIYVLLHTANEMFLARKSRLVGRMSGGDERRWLAASMGALLAKTYDLSDDVFLAMQSRGFRGEVYVLDTFRMTPYDWMWLAIFLITAGIAMWLGRLS